MIALIALRILILKFENTDTRVGLLCTYQFEELIY